MKCAKLGASPQKPSLELVIAGFASKAKQRLIGFGYMHVLVMHGMSSLIYSLSLMSIVQRRTPKPTKSSVRSSGFRAFKFHINSKSLRLNLKKHALTLIPIFASFYIFCFYIQCHLRPQWLIWSELGASTLLCVSKTLWLKIEIKNTTPNIPFSVWSWIVYLPSNTICK